MIDLDQLTRFSQLPLFARQSIAVFINSLLEDNIAEDDSSSLRRELEKSLEIDLIESMLLFLQNSDEYLSTLISLEKQEKKELLISVVDIMRKNEVTNKTSMISGFFEKLGLTIEEQAHTILENDNAKGATNISGNHLKQKIKGMLSENIERQTIAALNQDPLKGSPFEGMRFMGYLSTPIESYKKGIADKKSEFEAEGLDINQIFNEIRDELTSKHLELPR